VHPDADCGSDIAAATLSDISHGWQIIQSGDNARAAFLSVAKPRQQMGEIARWMQLNWEQ